VFFVSKQKKIESGLAEYRQKILLCLSIFEESFKEYVHRGDRAQLQANFLKIRRAESNADDIRREIEVMMYSKALFPESRGDILELLEAMDRVPNQMESIVGMLFNQHINIPQTYRQKLVELVGICHKCVDVMLEGSAKLFSDFTNATVAVGRIDELESEAARVEGMITEQIFSSDLNGFEKILLRDLVEQIATVSDRAENVGDKIRLIVTKRNV